jgi:hypothetical protein
MASHVVALQTGSSTSEFNSNQWKINRANMLLMEANRWSRITDLSGTQEWCRILNCFEREFWNYAGPLEKDKIKSKRITEAQVNIPPQCRTTQQTTVHLSLIRQKLWDYENSIRELMDAKGFGPTASQDASDKMFDG